MRLSSSIALLALVLPSFAYANAPTCTTPVAFTFIVDTASPIVSITAPVAGSTLSSSVFPQISGSTESWLTVVVRTTSGAILCTTVATASGTWACTPTAVLPQGSFTLVASTIDTAGNTGTTNNTFTVASIGSGGGWGWGGWGGGVYTTPFTPTASSPIYTRTGTIGTGSMSTGNIKTPLVQLDPARSLFPAFVGKCDASTKDLNDPKLIAYYPTLDKQWTDLITTERRVTRGEFLTMLLRAAGKTVPVSANSAPTYQDVSLNSAYSSVVEYATANGIVSGQNGRFRPNDTISRAEVAKILVRGANIGLSTDIRTFADISSQWDLRPYIQTAYDHCILHGRQTWGGETNLTNALRVFEPTDGITLAESVKVLYNVTHQ